MFWPLGRSTWRCCRGWLGLEQARAYASPGGLPRPRSSSSWRAARGRIPLASHRREDVGPGGLTSRRPAQAAVGPYGRPFTIVDLFAPTG
ncbi:hypothetical protein QJS66_10790 [Kocuria rhizophila]|nr:hypothetical protein QJS66_10790 [Kocuria rhizophila]